VALAIVILLATQDAEPLALVFEAVSAFGTVGLSTGVTPGLTPLGKLTVMGLMFAGRTGPITLGFALAVRHHPARVTYPAEKIMIG
jgi:trk system potassium uptake protein TrkH